MLAMAEIRGGGGRGKLSEVGIGPRGDGGGGKSSKESSKSGPGAEGGLSKEGKGGGAIFLQLTGDNGESGE